MCEEKPEVLEVENLEASHPRVAGIVQTHRQQVDTLFHPRWYAWPLGQDHEMTNIPKGYYVA